MSTRSAESREDSPDGSPEKRISKKRKVLSCYACRNRKMKCDRLFPVCGRCQKTGRADQCTYDPRLIEELPTNGDGHAEPGPPSFAPQYHTDIALASSDTLNWKLRAQDRRLEMMEKKLAALEGTKHSSFDLSSSRFDNVQPEELMIREDMMFRGKGFKTQFYGSTSPLSSLNQFSELQAFTREALNSDGNMHRIRHDFKAFRERRKIILKDKGHKMHGYDEEVFALVPQKSIVDQHVAVYFQTWETSYRILHEPTFWKDYQTFWARKSNDEILASFAAILIYIVAITKCARPNNENVFVGDSSADREDALNLVNACDVWLARQSRKQLTLAFFQLQCFSLLSKRANCLKLKQDWVNSGEMMRLAIASGMHRNPSLLAGGRISEYEKEMRRRIWVTIAELELQTSIDCGLQSSLCGLYFDVQPPANLPDDAFSPDMPQIPAGRPIEHFTSASYLNVALKSLPLRVHMMQLLNNPTTDLQYTDVLHYDAQITSLLATIPTWDDQRATTASALLDFQLRQFLLILHRPYAKLAANNQRYSYSLTVCVDAASNILSSYENLVSKGMLALNNIRNDVLRTGVTLAQTVYYNCTLTSASDLPPTLASNIQSMDVGSAAMGKQPFSNTSNLKIAHLPQNNFLTTTLCTTAIDLLEKVRQLFEYKLLRLGTGYIEYWLLCAAIGIMPSTNQPVTSIASITNTAPDDLQSRARKALERVTSLCFRVLALQKDPENNFAAALRNTVALPSPAVSNQTNTTPIAINNENVLPTFIPGAGGLASAMAEGTDIGGAFDDLQDMQVDLAGWTFPDFWSFDVDGGF
ncbi:hypothetical protein CC80DRAFT_556481 [Byssothecium circinans]|uniref:Zn(2)-C6 fungal-type domain-containing protein n=1 Tax=Byssothecium circinans TaxID=147558 RepID=A0A6A5TBP7_9PLEO|nr:hypothetical protein CC80DRAFT_432115 [Byssothecium circinans]KAF1948297.1 hypothetical protein CC80DRAFT_556481 [Byssothecium circinans]